MDLVKKAVAVTKYTPEQVTQEDGKIWFVYVTKEDSAIPAFYDIAERKFKSVVEGVQYGGFAVRNLVAQPVVANILK